MATREEIQLALDVIKMINQMGRGLRSSAQGMLTQQNARIQAIIDNSTKQTILVNGLDALGVSVSSLNADKNAVATICQYVLDNVPEIVEL